MTQTVAYIFLAFPARIRAPFVWHNTDDRGNKIHIFPGCDVVPDACRVHLGKNGDTSVVKDHIVVGAEDVKGGKGEQTERESKESCQSDGDVHSQRAGIEPSPLTKTR